MFVEKPFTCTTAQAEELIELAERKHLKIMVDHTFLFTGAVKRIRQLINDGTLGELYYYDSTRVNLGLFQHDVNVIWDLAPHDLSIMNYLLDVEPEALVATGQLSDFVLKALGSDYVDLFLIHWPLPTLYDGDFVSTWRTLEEFRNDGRARSIGVSNFQIPHLQRLARETDTTPAVNQIEVHPYFTNDAVRSYGADHGIATEAWSPIAQGKVLGDPLVRGIADSTGKTPAQVVLRWHIQRGDIVFPKSVTPERIRENFALFDFELTNSDMDALTALDRGETGRTGPNPDQFDYIQGSFRRRALAVAPQLAALWRRRVGVSRG